jgi:Trk K+ transport system NAD-binding subunit/Kef-type K+ transport system membrane component KefB
MDITTTIIIPLLTFVIIAFASESISKFFAKIHLPLISGLIFTGIIVGPYVLKVISIDAITHLTYLLDISLAFIAMAAGNELHIEELKDSLKSIKYNTFSQLILTFTISAFGIFLLADYIPFMNNMETGIKISISALLGTIFIARSPSSAIAIIKEMRAKGPFVSTAIGVIVLIDVLVVIFFAIVFSFTESIIDHIPLHISLIGIIILELLSAIVLAFIIAKIMEFVFSLKIHQSIKTALVILLGYSAFIISELILHWSLENLNIHFFVEPLLVALLASFYITNFTKHKLEFSKILHDNGLWIYVVFFTLTGANLSLDLFTKVWEIALVLFLIRIAGLYMGSILGGLAAKNPKKHIKYGWFPYLTQAGIGIGLATEISEKYPVWGNDAFTIIIAVIVLSQIIGPPLFKYSILKVGEAHLKAPDHQFDGIKDLLIFGYENLSHAVAVELEKSGWNVKIATFLPQDQIDHLKNMDITSIDKIDLEVLKKLDTGKIEAALLLFDDDKNYQIADLLYEYFGTREVIVRITDKANYQKFKDLNCYVIDPSKAMINLMMQYIKSPTTATLLLGELKGQSSIDIEVRDLTVVGRYLRNIHLPPDVIILSIERNGQIIITHGFTKLELGDIMTVVGSEESLEELELKFGMV